MNKQKIIYGDGFIAKKFSIFKNILKKKKIILYASGISNSQENLKKNLDKEINLFKKFYQINKNSKIIYISTCSINDNSRNKSKYIKNKIKIEKFIKAKFKKFIILRLPELIGRSRNKNTLINYFFYMIKNKKKFFLFKNVKRNILDIDDVLKISKQIILDDKINKKIMPLSNKFFYTPENIVKIIEKKLSINAVYKLKFSKNQNWNLNDKFVSKYIKKAKIKFNKNYLQKTFKKYF